MSFTPAKKFLVALSLVALTGIPMLASAQASNGAPCNNAVGGICLPTKPTGSPNYDTLGEVVNAIINIALTVVGLVAVIFLIVGGYRYITAGANDEKVSAAKSTIKNSLIGLIIVLLAWAIVVLVAGVAKNPEGQFPQQQGTPDNSGNDLRQPPRDTGIR